MSKNPHDIEPKRDRYHHGNLRSVLIDHGAQLLAEKGVEGFSMREVARRAGVSVAAPRPHFGHAMGLLTAIAACGFETLTERQTQEMERSNDPIEKVILLCKTYVKMARSHPGYAAIMFRWDLVDKTDKKYADAAGGALEALTRAVAEALDERSHDVDVEHAAKTLWAAMQGFVTLSLSDGERASTRIEFAVRAVLIGAIALAEER